MSDPYIGKTYTFVRTGKQFRVEGIAEVDLPLLFYDIYFYEDRYVAPAYLSRVSIEIMLGAKLIVEDNSLHAKT